MKTPLPKPTPEMLGLKAARAAAYAPRVAASVDGTLGFSGIRAAGSGGVVTPPASRGGAA